VAPPDYEAKWRERWEAEGVGRIADLDAVADGEVFYNPGGTKLAGRCRALHLLLQRRTWREDDRACQVGPVRLGEATEALIKYLAGTSALRSDDTEVGFCQRNHRFINTCFMAQ
jgi:hypothetical protein